MSEELIDSWIYTFKHRFNVNPQSELLNLHKYMSTNEGGCMVWKKEYTGQRYRQVRFQGRKQMLHRIIYFVTYGPIPEGLLVCHRCDNPPCCNPAHLFLGTAKDNTADMDAKARRVVKRGFNSLEKGLLYQISDAFKSGGSDRTVAKLFNISLRTVQRVKKFTKTWRD